MVANSSSRPSPPSPPPPSPPPLPLPPSSLSCWHWQWRDRVGRCMLLFDSIDSSCESEFILVEELKFIEFRVYYQSLANTWSWWRSSPSSQVYIAPAPGAGGKFFFLLPLPLPMNREYLCLHVSRGNVLYLQGKSA